MSVSREPDAQKNIAGPVLEELQGENAILKTAIAYGMGQVVRDLLKNKNQGNYQDRYRRTLLHYAAWFDEIIIAEDMLKQPDILINTPDGEGKTPLHFCSHQKTTRVITALLQRKNIQVNQADKDGKTPLHEAVILNNVPVIIKLLEHQDTNVNVFDNSGKTPLHYAAEMGLDAAVAELLKHKDTKVNQEDKQGNTPLSMAGYHEYGRVAGELLRHKDIQANLKNKYDYKAIECANRYGYSADVKKYLRAYIESYYNRREKDGPQLHWYSSLFGFQFGVPREDKLAAAKFLLKNIENPMEVEKLEEFGGHKKALQDGELGDAFRLLKY